VGSYLRLLLVLADWPLAHRSLTIADSLVHLVSGTPRYEMIMNIIKHEPRIFPSWAVRILPIVSPPVQRQILSMRMKTRLQLHKKTYALSLKGTASRTWHMYL
jgi:hypothetical protein